METFDGSTGFTPIKNRLYDSPPFGWSYVPDYTKLCEKNEEIRETINPEEFSDFNYYQTIIGVSVILIILFVYF